MNQERYQLLKKLIAEAFELPEVQRDVFLQEQCEDHGLLSEARDLLAHYRPEDEESIADFGAPIELSEMAGQKLGKYQIIEPIGEGGMGVVYMAAQSAPLRRKVALKVIKLGMDTKEVITRFESERQALALMDHPNIAKVLDAGATEEGRPFFVMEFIPGVPLNQYCNDHELGLRLRLDLFMQVCRGVQHAHQKGIIHRDLKPGNILVTEVEDKPVPKIIDFGVAKATGQHLAAQTMFTRMGQMIGTPEYMSPEQAGTSMEDVDTRSDVYSLGVLLYELLTGMLPLERQEIMRAGLERMALHVQNEIPKKPSTRIDTESKTNTRSSTVFGIDARLWVKKVQGDLDWITMKALEKERDRRYGSPADLAEDLERHLNNHPVQAGPPSGLYRIRKFVKRNRTGVTVGLLFLVALLAGAIGTTVGLVRAKRANSEALASANRAEAATLYQMARSEKSPALAFPYIIGALERDDRMEYRLQAKKLLLLGPPYWRLPVPAKSHNAHMVDISSDGRWMVVGWRRNGSLQLFPLEGGEPVMLSGHQGAITWARFSSDSRHLVTAANDSTVMLWSPSERKLLRKWRFSGNVLPFLDSSKNRLITREKKAGTPPRWMAWPIDGVGGVELGMTELSVSGVVGMPWADLDPTRRWLVQPQGKRLVLYDLEDLPAGPIRTVGLHDIDIRGVEFSPDGSTIASYDQHGSVLLWDLESGKSEPIRRLQSNPEPIYIRFDFSGKKLAAGGIGGMRVWDLSQSRAVKPREFVPRNWAFAAAFHPSGEWLVTTGDFLTLAAWPMVNEQPEVLKVSENSLGALAFSPDGRHLIIGSENGDVHDLFLEGDSIGDLRTIHTAVGFNYNEIHFDDSSSHVFLSTCNSIQGIKTISKISLDGDGSQLFEGFTCNFVLDGTGRYLASPEDPGLANPYVWFYDSVTGQGRLLDESVGGFQRALGFTLDGGLLVQGPEGFGLWNHDRNEYSPIPRSLRAYSLAKDRQTILLVSPEGVFWRQNVNEETMEKLPLKFHPGTMYYFAVDSTAACLAGGFVEGGIQILDMDTRQIHRAPLYETLAAVVAIDPKKRWIATAGLKGDGILKLITYPRGKPLEERSYDELMITLKKLTNLRVESDEKEKFGYKMVGQGVPDWDNPPRW